MDKGYKSVALLQIEKYICIFIIKNIIEVSINLSRGRTELSFYFLNRK